MMRAAIPYLVLDLGFLVAECTSLVGAAELFHKAQHHVYSAPVPQGPFDRYITKSF